MATVTVALSVNFIRETVSDPWHNSAVLDEWSASGSWLGRVATGQQVVLDE